MFTGEWVYLHLKLIFPSEVLLLPVKYIYMYVHHTPAMELWKQSLRRRRQNSCGFHPKLSQQGFAVELPKSWTSCCCRCFFLLWFFFKNKYNIQYRKGNKICRGTIFSMFESKLFAYILEHFNRKVCWSG